jgi:hypothetical protein
MVLAHPTLKVCPPFKMVPSHWCVLHSAVGTHNTEGVPSIQDGPFSLVCPSFCSLFERLVPAEAGVEKEVCQRVVEVGPQTDDAVVLIGIASEV